MKKEHNFYSIFINYFPGHRLWTIMMKKPARGHSRPNPSLSSSTFSVTFISLNLLLLVLQSQKHLAFEHIQYSTLMCRSDCSPTSVCLLSQLCHRDFRNMGSHLYMQQWRNIKLDFYLILLHKNSRWNKKCKEWNCRTSLVAQ